MTGSYTEASVKRKADVSGYLAKIGMVFLIGILFAFGLLTGQQIIAVIAIGIGCFCWFYLFPNCIFISWIELSWVSINNFRFSLFS